MNKPYHRFVFNEDGLVGQFEAMYQAEDREGFDAWCARDPRHLRMRLVREMLADYNFNSVLDLGCGIGSVTQSFKRANNGVLGVDISPTAIKKASETYPDISWVVGDITQSVDYGPQDLVSVLMVLAYVPEWRKVLESLSKVTRYSVVCEYVPPGAWGAVHSIAHLEEEFCRWFVTERKVVMNDTTIILFGRAK